MTSCEKLVFDEESIARSLRCNVSGSTRIRQAPRAINTTAHIIGTHKFVILISTRANGTQARVAMREAALSWKNTVALNMTLVSDAQGSAPIHIHIHIHITPQMSRQKTQFE